MVRTLNFCWFRQRAQGSLSCNTSKPAVGSIEAQTGAPKLWERKYFLFYFLGSWSNNLNRLTREKQILNVCDAQRQETQRQAIEVYMPYRAKEKPCLGGLQWGKTMYKMRRANVW